MNLRDWWWCFHNGVCPKHLTELSWTGICWECREEQEKMSETLEIIRQAEFNKNLERLREKYGSNNHTENDG